MADYCFYNLLVVKIVFFLINLNIIFKPCNAAKNYPPNINGCLIFIRYCIVIRRKKVILNSVGIGQLFIFFV